MISIFMAFEGVYSIIPTAFTDSGDIDPASQRKVVDLFIDKGANGLTALGVTGEVPRLEEPERREVLEIVVTHAAGRVADVFYRAVPLMRFEFQEGIGMAIRKDVLRRRGALTSAATRAPSGALDKATAASLDRVLAWVTSQKGMEWISV